ncbi:MAG: hypothetical protein JRJ78_12400 [Deltaproteobacteria bacterium]|nr:hypothetical protein [Deltaproteobacteria bacterium]MBW2015250.1 hypothetical protein [Deltaproteobacteria bacterium]MBW2302349.1 hypothetical protein [Deltaproteobacteria bacterium]
MGEIRSTMDIIMEKLQGISVSEEEKKGFREQEIKGKVKGLVQRYIDGALDIHRMKREASDLWKQDEDLARRLLTEEVLNRLEPGKNEEAVFQAMEDVLGLETGPLRKKLWDYTSQLEEEKKKQMASLMKKLENKGISGSAVLPNLKADPGWKTFTEEKRKALKDALDGWKNGDDGPWAPA